MTSAIIDITVGVFEYMEITFKMDADKRIKYTERILRGSLLKYYIQVLAECKKL